MALLRNTKQKNLRSVSFGQEQAERPHSVTREVNDLREDVELAFERIEKRVNLPEVHDDTITADANADTVGCAFKGINFLAGRSLATITLDNAITLSAVGEAGNDLSVEITDTGAGGISLDGNIIKITVNGGVTDADALKTLVGGDADVRKLVIPTVTVGATKITTLSNTKLAGGSGDGFSATIYNASKSTSLALSDLSKVTLFDDTALTIAGAALAGDAGNKVAIAFVSHTSRTVVLGAYA